MSSEHRQTDRKRTNPEIRTHQHMRASNPTFQAFEQSQQFYNMSFATLVAQSRWWTYDGHTRRRTCVSLNPLNLDCFINWLVSVRLHFKGWETRDFHQVVWLPTINHNSQNVGVDRRVEWAMHRYRQTWRQSPDLLGWNHSSHKRVRWQHLNGEACSSRVTLFREKAHFD